MFNNLKKDYLQKGYFTIKKIFDESTISTLINEIEVAKNVDKYLDKNGKIRRIEKLFNKGNELTFINNQVLKILRNVFEEDYTIFKDKFNAKPPGGEGFFAHYDGVFMFTDKNNVKKKGWYEYSDTFLNVLISIYPCNKVNCTI